jgi:excisionase family DNA binding protein
MNDYFNSIDAIKWLRSRDVRKMLGISDSTLQTMRISGTIPAYRLGSSWFYRYDEIIAALEASRITKSSSRDE